MARRKPVPLPVRTQEEVVAAYPHLRQSRLGDFDSCRLMTKFALEAVEYTNGAQARGILFHRYAAHVLRTLRRTGEVSMDVSEALEILYEQCAQHDVADEDVVVAPASERRLLRIAAIKFVQGKEFPMHRLIDVERRLYAPVTYHPEHGPPVERLITGQPDALVADPPNGAVVPDWKTTLRAPAEYDGEQEDTDAGVSYMGYFQQRVYALLVMHNYPSVERVTLREFYVLDGGEVRTATVERKQLEHIERELAVQAELFDRAVAGGSRSALWAPSPGKHCSYCPRPQRCTMREDDRVAAGGIATRAEASRAAAAYVVADTVRGRLREGLRPIVEMYGDLPVKTSKGRYVLGWRQNKTGDGRRFGVHVPARSDRGPKDPSLDEAFAEAAARKEAAA